MSRTGNAGGWFIIFIIIIMSGVDFRANNVNWAEKAFERFPLTLFSGAQSFMVFQNLTDFLGGVLEFPIALVQ